MKLGPPNSDINSMRSRAAARDTTPERAGVSEMSRVAGRAMLSFLGWKGHALVSFLVARPWQAVASGWFPCRRWPREQ